MGRSVGRFSTVAVRGGAMVAVGMLVARQADATAWYVSPSGSNGNSGTSSSKPFQTLQYAEGMTNPGDTVYVMPGTYTTSGGNDVVLINRSGTASAPITYTAY